MAGGRAALRVDLCRKVRLACRDGMSERAASQSSVNHALGIFSERVVLGRVSPDGFLPRLASAHPDRSTNPPADSYANFSYMNDQPASIAKNWAVWEVPTPSISVATKCAACSGSTSLRIGSEFSICFRIAGSLSAPASSRNPG